MTTAERLLRVTPVLIGLWRFHHATWAKPQWCCTWSFCGQYRDTFHKPTPDAALDAVYKNWMAAKRKQMTEQVFSNGRWVDVLTMPNYDARKKYRWRVRPTNK